MKFINFNKLETKIVTGISFFINLFIIGTFTSFSDRADLIQLKDTGIALESILGPFAVIIFGLGLFASGQSSTVAGVLTGQHIMEGFLNFKINRDSRIVISRLINMIPCLLIIKYMDVEWVYIVLNIVQVIQLPFVLIPMFKFIEVEKIINDIGYSKDFFRGLKLISALFLVMNMGQIISSLPQSSDFLVIFIISIFVYFYVMWRLWNMKIVRKIQTNQNESFDLGSIEC